MVRRGVYKSSSNRTKFISTCCVTAALAFGINCASLPVDNALSVDYAFADEIGLPEEVGQTFQVGNCTYKVISASSSEAPAVALTKVDAGAEGGVEVPDTVTSGESGCAYTVTKVYFKAFSYCSKITSVTLPSSITAYTFAFIDSVDVCFLGCSSLEQINVREGNSLFASYDGVLYALDSAGNPASILAYPQAKTAESYTVPDTVHTVFSYAFANNVYLKSVTFTSGLTGNPTEYEADASSAYIGGIGAYAFSGCTNLSAIEFPHNSNICTLSQFTAPAIREYAFQNCTSLETFTIPAITSTARKSNYYHTFKELNPNTTLKHEDDIGEFISGYMAYWHNSAGPVARCGIEAEAFKGCANLKTLVFESNGDLGAFAYLIGSKAFFDGCVELESIVYEGKQAYWGNPNASMQNGVYTDIWLDSDGNTVASPTYYYSVNYYATQQDAEADNDSADNRLARVEYKRGTSVCDIATSASSLAECTVEKSLYAQTSEDGNIPDPNEAARKAGLGEGNWTWKLSDSQSKREGLTESCYAYLVNEDDLSAGRLDATQITALYRQCDRNLSEGIVSDTLFDPYRYETDSSYVISPFVGENRVWFRYSFAAQALTQSYAVVAADGTTLSSDQYTVSYQTYNAQTKEFEDANLGDKTGAFLVTVTPTEDSGYTGVLQEWILVENYLGTFTESYSDNIEDVSYEARHPYGASSSLDFGSAAYSVTVGSGDVYGALMGASYAGLVNGAINVEESDDFGYGFTINTSTYSDGYVKDGSKSVEFRRAELSGDITAAGDCANEFFDTIESRRDRLGISESEYPWGDTAVLINVNYADNLSSVAAYVYANKTPVFFTEEDGTVSPTTLKHLALFDNVAVVGNTTQFSDENYSSLESSLAGTSNVFRLGDSANTVGAFSIAIAQILVDEGKATYSNVSVSDGSNPVEVIAALTNTGHCGGITLVTKSTAESKAIAELLHDNSADIEWLALYGAATTANATDLNSITTDDNAFDAIWSTDSEFALTLQGVNVDVDEYADTDIHGSSKSKDADDDKDEDADDDKKDSEDSDDSDSANRGSESATEVIIDNSNVVLKVRASNASASAVTGSASASVVTGKTSANSSLATTEINAQTANDASTAIEADESESSSDSAPLSTSAPFVAVLAALCGSAIPILRRTK